MAKSYTLSELAEFLEAPFEGEGGRSLTAIADLKDAGVSDIAFLSNKEFEPFLKQTRAGAVLLREGVAAPACCGVIRVANPYLAYARLTSLFAEQVGDSGIHPSAVISPRASIADDVHIGPMCVIEDDVVLGEGSRLQAQVFVGRGSRIGRNARIYANVSLQARTTLGDDVIIHSATVIGADGFGFAPSDKGWIKIYQLGGVTIGNRVEIGASTTIDRGAINDTVIADGVIIDDQVHIAHNCRIGEGTAIAGCTGIAGSTIIGKGCTIGGGVGIAGHIQIGDDVHFNGGSIVTKSITEPGHYGSGTPIQDVRTWRRNAVRQGQLHEWVERIKKLERSAPTE